MGEVVNGVSLSALDTEESLYKLLDATEDLDERKKVRLRLREVQAINRAKRDEAMRRREEEREEAIQQRHREAQEQKRRMLAMYDQMAKSAPAGGNKVMDISIYKGEEPSPEQIQQLAPKRDLVEEGIQQRQKEATDRKRKLLAAYDAAARSGTAGPKTADFDALTKPSSPVNHKPPEPIMNHKPPENQKVSAKAKFQQMDAAHNKGAGGHRPSFHRVGGVARSASDIKDMLLQWCKGKTKEYDKIEITNFSTSWNDGMAFCALIHHFYPDAFDFNALNPKNRRHNFDLAFRTAEEKADIAPLLDVEDMVLMKKPDWKCVFTYIQSMYRKLHDMS